MKPGQLKAGVPVEMRLLVSELIKREPNLQRIKELAEKSGLEYMDDPIEMMSAVLKRMNGTATGRRTKRKVHETSL